MKPLSLFKTARVEENKNNRNFLYLLAYKAKEKKNNSKIEYEYSDNICWKTKVI